jgi:hypothetical protein
MGHPSSPIVASNPLASIDWMSPLWQAQQTDCKLSKSKNRSRSLNAGANGTAVNEEGLTPFELAKVNEALAGADAYWALNDARFE